MIDDTRPNMFEVRYDETLLRFYDPASFPTAEAVIADMSRWIDDLSTSTPGSENRFEVWRGGVMVASARRGVAAAGFVPGRPGDPARGMSARTRELFDRFFFGPPDR